MRIIDTSLITEEQDASEAYWTYNGLDCCITEEVRRQIEPLALEQTATIYNFERAMQAPALEMMLRGIRVNLHERDRRIVELEAKKAQLEAVLNAYGEAVWGKPLNHNSPTQLKEFFYTVMQIPVQYKIAKGERVPSTDREALEKMYPYFYARPITLCILALRDVTKKLGVLRSGIDADQRMRFGLNVAGTETGRWSSNQNCMGGGTNGQNITDELRSIFIADNGYKLAYLDLEQAESRDVGLLSWVVTGDSSYLDACESGDLHTTVCKMVWPERPWTGDAAKDKELAEAPFYRMFSYRDMAKRGGHGTNYYGTPRTMAGHLKVEAKVMERFQANYFSGFPSIKGWHNWTATTLQTEGILTTLFGRRRTFFGRRFEDATLREAIAYMPQSMVGDRLNLGMWRIWKKWGHVKIGGKPVVQLLLQIHDAVLLQYLQSCESWIIGELIKCLEIPVTATCRAEGTPDFGKSRTMIIPSEAQVGWNWGKFVDPADLIKKYGSIEAAAKKNKFPNPHGIKKLKGSDKREPPTYRAYSILDRVIA